MEKTGGDQSKKVLENIKNLKSEEKFLKLASIRQLGLIVQVLGPERTISELFPYMQEVLEEDDEVLIALCDSLTQLPLDYCNLTIQPFFDILSWDVEFWQLRHNLSNKLTLN